MGTPPVACSRSASRVILAFSADRRAVAATLKQIYKAKGDRCERLAIVWRM
jgi:hypothetical protein